MKNKEVLLNQLIANRKMSSYEEIELYEEAVNNLFSEDDINVIDLLINGFLDDTESEEVMFSTLHGIEFYSKKEGVRNYILKIIPLLKHLKNDAYEWSETLFLRLLNSDESFKVLQNEVNFFQQIDKDYIVKLIQSLINRNPKRFEEKGRELLSILKVK